MNSETLKALLDFALEEGANVPEIYLRIMEQNDADNIGVAESLASVETLNGEIAKLSAEVAAMNETNKRLFLKIGKSEPEPEPELEPEPKTLDIKDIEI